METVYNGRKYLPGQPWLPEDGGDPPGPEDGFSIRQDNAPAAGQQADLAGTSACKGRVSWIPQHGRVQPASLMTPEEKERLRVNPYDSLNDLPAPPPAPDDQDGPAVGQKKQTAPVAPFQRTQEEIDDPFGLTARAAARTEELQANLDEEKPEEE